MGKYFLDNPILEKILILNSAATKIKPPICNLIVILEVFKVE